MALYNGALGGGYPKTLADAINVCVSWHPKRAHNVKFDHLRSEPGFVAYHVFQDPDESQPLNHALNRLRRRKVLVPRFTVMFAKTMTTTRTSVTLLVPRRRLKRTMENPRESTLLL